MVSAGSSMALPEVESGREAAWRRTAAIISHYEPGKTRLWTKTPGVLDRSRGARG